MINVYFAVEVPLLLAISVVSYVLWVSVVSSVTLLVIWFEGVSIAGFTHSGTSSSFMFQHLHRVNLLDLDFFKRKTLYALTVLPDSSEK